MNGMLAKLSVVGNRCRVQTGGPQRGQNL